MISVLWSFGERIPRTEQSQNPMLEMGPRSHKKWQLLEGHTAFLCAQHLGGTVSNCCFLRGVTVTPSTHGVVLPLVLPVPLLSLLCAAFHFHDLFPMGTLIPPISLISNEWEWQMPFLLYF